MLIQRKPKMPPGGWFLVERWLPCVALVVLLFHGLGAGLHSAAAYAGGAWMFAMNRPVEAVSPPASRQPVAFAAQAADRPSQPEPPAHIFGYPRRQDPLFDTGTRLPYSHQHTHLPQWNRPRYGSSLPQYVKPSLAQEPVRKPMYHKPAVIAPLDNKPKYFIDHYVPPSVSKPSYERPTYMDRPNYVRKPIEKPALDRPGYDRSGIFYGRPAYNPPVVAPEPYKPPRYAPPPWIAPPR